MNKITFKTDLDNAQIEKDLKSLESKIKKSQSEIEKSEQAKLPLVEQSKELGVQLDIAKEKLEQLNAESKKISLAMQPGSDPATFIDAASRKSQVESDLKSQQKEVDTLQKKWDSVNTKVDNYDAKIQSATASIAESKEEATNLTAKMSKGGVNLSGVFSSAAKSAKHLEKRIIGLAKRVLVFSVIATGLRRARQYTTQLLQTNDAYVAQMAKLKGAVLTAFQPLYEAILPGIIGAMKVLTSVVQTLAAVFSFIFGTNNAKQNAEDLYDEAHAIGAVGGAAKKAAKSLAGFDEIQKVGANDTGGGGGSIGGIKPDFNTDIEEDKLKRILHIIELIAAGLLALHFGHGFLGTLQKALGFFLAINGAVGYVKSFLDAWREGIDWDNLSSMIFRLAEAIIGLGLALGPTAAAIGAIVGGLSLLAVGLHDMIENGVSLKNVIASISGMLTAGAGISLLVGSWIPLLVAAIASLLLTITGAFGDTEQLVDGMKKILNGFKDFFSGVFSGDIEKTCKGIEEIFSGLKNVLFSIIDAIRNMFNSFLGWLDSKTKGKLHGIIETIKGLFNGAFGFIKNVVKSVLSGVQQMLTGLVQFVGGVFTGKWQQAWDGVKNIFKGVWNGIVGIIESGVNLLIQGLNWLIRQMNKISFTAPPWVPLVGGKHVGVNIPSISEIQLPRLAKGAVLPANKPFLSVVGDQTHGTNIEAPLETIQEAVANVMGDMSSGMMAGFEASVGVQREILEAVLGINIGDDMISNAVTRYNRKMNVVNGGAL